jgi:hypothetical protein
MNTIDIVLLVIVFLVMIYRYRTAKQELKILRREEPQSVIIKVEVINDHIYLWDDLNSDFLAQGKNLDEAIKVLEERFPNTKFMMKKSDLAMNT